MALSSVCSIYSISSCWNPSHSWGWYRVMMMAKDSRSGFLVVFPCQSYLQLSCVFTVNCLSSILCAGVTVAPNILGTDRTTCSVQNFRGLKWIDPLKYPKSLFAWFGLNLWEQASSGGRLESSCCRGVTGSTELLWFRFLLDSHLGVWTRCSFLWILAISLLVGFVYQAA